MLIDLLASDNVGSYNIKIANIMGLHTSIYINELMNISNKAHEKNKLVDGKHFLLDRKYILKRTTIGVDEQLAIDYKLRNVGVIDKPEGGVDIMSIDIDKLASLIIVDDAHKLAQLSAKTQVKIAGVKGAKQTMKEKLSTEMKTYITTSNDELRVAFEAWVDAIVENPKSCGITKTKVSIFQRDVHTFANGDLDVALKIVEIATVHSYIDAQWAIQYFNKNFASDLRKRLDGGSSKKRSVSIGSEAF